MGFRSLRSRYPGGEDFTFFRFPILVLGLLCVTDSMMVSFFRIITHVLGEHSAQFDFFPLAFGYVMLLIYSFMVSRNIMAIRSNFVNEDGDTENMSG